MALRAANVLSVSKAFLPIIWLDTCLPASQFDAKQVGTAVGPNIEGRSVTEEIVLPPVCLYALTNVTVAARSSAFVSQKGVIIERVLGVDEGRCAFQGEFLLDHGRHFAAVARRPVTSIDSGFFLSGYGYWNYYHWMLELLPKLQYWHRLAPELRTYPLLVGEAVREYKSLLDALAMFCTGAEIRVLKDDEVYEVGHLLHINAPNASPFNLRAGDQDRVADFRIRPEVIYDWRRRVGLGQRPSAGGGRRLFLARRGDRRSYNQAEVLELFIARGFEAVYLERMTLQEQIDAMSSAELLAGPAGSAWTNLIFCKGSTKGLSWIAEESKDAAVYSTIASIVGVDLRYLTYPTGARSTAELYSANYRLEVTEVDRALREVLADTQG